MKTKNKILEVFKVFQDKESFFDDISKQQSSKLIINQIIIICLFAFLYGVAMGCYHSFLQSIVAGLKVVILFLSTIVICFPSFFIVQLILGSKMKFRQMIVIILSGIVLTSTIALSFAPVVIFFLITGNNYYFLQLLHVAIFIFAGIFGIKLIIESLKYACEKKDIYPQTGVTVFRIWAVILALVEIQLAWNLRPFLSDRNEEFKLFRKYKGNFYTAVIYSVEQLMKKENKENINTEKIIQPADTLNHEIKDSIDILKLIEK